MNQLQTVTKSPRCTTRASDVGLVVRGGCLARHAVDGHVTGRLAAHLARLELQRGATANGGEQKLKGEVARKSKIKSARHFGVVFTRRKVGSLKVVEGG